jgi:hypothetical protein
VLCQFFESKTESYRIRFNFYDLGRDEIDVFIRLSNAASRVWPDLDSWGGFCG